MPLVSSQGRLTRGRRVVDYVPGCGREAVTTIRRRGLLSENLWTRRSKLVGWWERSIALTLTREIYSIRFDYEGLLQLCWQWRSIAIKLTAKTAVNDDEKATWSVIWEITQYITLTWRPVSRDWANWSCLSMFSNRSGGRYDPPINPIRKDAFTR